MNHKGVLSPHINIKLHLVRTGEHERFCVCVCVCVFMCNMHNLMTVIAGSQPFIDWVSDHKNTFQWPFSVCVCVCVCVCECMRVCVCVCVFLHFFVLVA